MDASEVDHANRLAWGSRDVVRELACREGLWGEAEAQMLERVTEEARNEPTLDIGVGGGRTVPFLQPLTGGYVGIDYVPELVSATKARYPDARIEQMDARQLSFADNTFAVVLFSGNGLDGVTHADRHRILDEVNRVLRPGGLFAYSTIHLGYSQRRNAKPRDWRRILLDPGRTARRLLRMPAVARKYRRLRALDEAGDDWASRATFGYGFAVCWHQITLAGALRELQEAGFSPVELCAADGAPLSRMPALHLVARKRRSPRTKSARGHPPRRIP